MLKSQQYFLSYFALIFILCLSSCFDYKEVEVLDYNGINIKSITTEKIEVQVSLRVKNPNNYKISIVDSDLELFVKDKKIGAAKVRENIVLKKNTTDDYKVTIETGLSDFLTGAVPVIAGLLFDNEIDLQIKGDIKARAKSLSKRFPIDLKEKVQLN